MPPEPSSNLRSVGQAPVAPAPERVTLSLPHHLDVALVTQHLLDELGCDDWHAVCQHGHQMVVQLTRGGAPAYAISYECSPPIEKAIYHGSRAWALTIIPLHGEDNVRPGTLSGIKDSLARLHG